ncbi:hypothetical protein J437_LFUL011285, partial [Ladona fulva]
MCRNCASRGIHVGCIPGPKSTLDRRKRNSQGQDAVVNIHRMDDDDDEEEIIVVDDDDVEECDNTCD